MKVQRKPAEGLRTPIDATSIKRSLEIERLTLLRDFKRPGGAQGYNKGKLLIDCFGWLY